jgi:hypothetical protein
MASVNLDDLDDVTQVIVPDIYNHQEQFRYWPTADMYRRAAIFERRRQLYDGEHARLFNQSGSTSTGSLTESEKRERDATLLAFNLMRRGPIQVADVLFRDPMQIATADSETETRTLEQIKRIEMESELSLRLYMLMRQTIPVKGEGALKVTIQANGHARIDSIPSECIDWEADPLNAERYVSATIGIVLEKDQLLVLEKHLAGRVQVECFEIEAEGNVAGCWKIGRKRTKLPPPFQAEYLTGLDHPTVYLLPNIQVEGTFHGQSDYTLSMIEQQRAIDDLESDVLRHANRKMNGGALVGGPSLRRLARIVEASAGMSNIRAFSAAADESETTPVIDRSKMQVIIEPEAENGRTRYLSMVAEFPGQEMVFKQLVRQLAWEGSIDISGLLDLNDRLNESSGKALMYRMQPTLGVAYAKATFLKPKIEAILFDAQKFEQFHRVSQIDAGVNPELLVEEYKPVRPTVKFQLGIPADLDAEQTRIVERKREGLIDTTSAIQRLDGCDEKKAQSMKNRIDEEDGARAMSRADALQRGIGAFGSSPESSSSASADESAPEDDTGMDAEMMDDGDGAAE